jgi:hypothetical protein
MAVWASMTCLLGALPGKTVCRLPFKPAVCLMPFSQETFGVTREARSALKLVHSSGMWHVPTHVDRHLLGTLFASHTLLVEEHC